MLMEFFFVFSGVFLIIFYTTQNGYEMKNESRKATNASLNAKPNGRIVNLCIIDPIQALFTTLTLIQERTSIILNMVLTKIDRKLKRNSFLHINNHQKNFLNFHTHYILLSQQNCYKSSYITL